MGLIVQKYGGTSVGNLERMRKVAEHIKARQESGDKIIAVVSAMDKLTDEMFDLIKSVSLSPSAREVDLFISTGEIQSAALLAIVLNEIGVLAKSLTAAQIGLMASPEYGNARMIRISNAESLRRLAERMVLVVTGFQGAHGDGEIVTLGRGGSDATAVGIACEVKADSCEIYTDVDGVFAVDPRIVPNAKRIERISPLQMIRMGKCGAGVMMPRSVEIGMNHNMPILVKISPSLGISQGGTLIVNDPVENIEQSAASNAAALAVKKVFGVVISGISNNPGQAALIFRAIRDMSLIDSVQAMSFKRNASISLLAEKEKTEEIKKRIESLKDFRGRATLTGKLAIITLVDEDMVDESGYFARMFSAISSREVNILGFSSADRAIAVIVDEKHLAKVAKVLAEEFRLTK
jgi:aspartate kinase